MIRLSGPMVGLVLLTGCFPTGTEYMKCGVPSLKFEVRRVTSESIEGWVTVAFSPPGANVVEILYLSPIADISNSDLQSTCVKQEETGTWTIVLSLNEVAKSNFGALSTKMAHETLKRERLAFIVDGKLLVAPFVNAPINTGVITVTGPFSEAEARRIA